MEELTKVQEDFISILVSDYITSSFLIEILLFLTAGIVGMIIRTFVNMQRNLTNRNRRRGDDLNYSSQISYSIGVIVISTTLLIIFGDALKAKFTSIRVMFGIGVLVNVILPQYLSRILNKGFIARLLGILFPKLEKALKEDLEEEKEEEKKREKREKEESKKDGDNNTESYD